ncbi:DUF1329 domain-containing protein [Cycloclasticus sp.]|uniref:DUF1329 domain-containing protein n=1 Tax=Cycloclasticus sp. TaxID=2024830 RepID=UPI000C0D8F75|nr:DUF1329 domain-containing protein [Cycloclasticus sp.]PHR47167.1 MAG: hypothetical protein COA48_11425 [Cycloclasticus sp.]
MKFLTLRTKKTIGIVLSAALLPGIAMAKLTAEEEAKLGINDTELTPMGAVRAGNAEGTIPAWNSEPMPIPAGGTADSLADPFADEKPLFTITAQNYTEHMDKLTAGQIGLFKQYPDSYKMHVYPSHRTGAYDKWVYDATLAQAKNVEMCDEYATESKVCLKNNIAGGGIPFPIPKSGAEASYNHFFSFKGLANDRMINGALIDSNGNRTDVIIRQRMIYPYWFPADSEIRSVKWYERDGGAMLCDSWQVEKPPRSSGLVFGGCNYIQNFDFQTYLYVPGQRRVRKAPEIGFHDSPSFASDGQRTVASRWMHYFGGKNTRFDYAKPVKKEKYIAYNNYKLGNKDLPFDEIFGEEHINPEVVRYELHRVWVLDSTLKEGQRHLYKRHTAYFDEDTWLGVAFEAYDAKDRLWRVGEQYNAFIPGPNVAGPLGDMQVDLINGRYTTFPYWQYQAGKEMGFGGQKVVSKEEEIGFNIDIFTPQGLRKFGRR